MMTDIYLYEVGPGSDIILRDPTAPQEEVEPPVDNSTNSITYTLSTWDGTPLPNLSSLEWALFKELKPSLFTTPVAKGTMESTNSGAEIKIEVLASVAPAGQYFLVLTNNTGVMTLACIVTVG